MRASSCLCAAATLLLASVGLAREASAAAPWVERRLTLPSGDWAFDVGLGVGHVPNDNAAGVNLAMAVGVVPHLELGVRTALRIGDPAERGIEADRYARLFDRQYGQLGDGVVANPELRLRWAFAETEIVGAGLEGRVLFPIENGTNASFVAGLPLAFHAGDLVRVDTGPMVSIVATPRRPITSLHLPVDVWFQATSRLWLGPEGGVTWYDLGGDAPTTALLLGFGLGYAVSRVVDFKAQFRFEDVDHTSNDWGLGAGVQIRIE